MQDPAKDLPMFNYSFSSTPDPEGVKHPYKGPAKGLPHDPKFLKKLSPAGFIIFVPCIKYMTPFPNASDQLKSKPSNATTIHTT
jgi:hypothetical protein